jgi:F-type H+-transporting ATPase subunit alpha
VRPAVNVGLSVSRVGGNAQTKAMKQVAGMLRLSLAQYRELAAFSQLSTDIDKSTKDQLTHGERMVEILKQDILSPLPLSTQVITIFAGTNGYLDDLKLSQVQPFIDALLHHIEQKYADIPHRLDADKVIGEEIQKKLRQAIEAFKKEFLQTPAA